MNIYLYSSSLYSCHVLISSASIRSILFLSFIVPIFVQNVPLVSHFLEEISSLSHSVVPSTSFYCSLRNAFLSLVAILWNSAFRLVYLSFSPLCFAFLLSSGICKASSESYFVLLNFFFLGMVLITTSCSVLHISIHSSSGTVSDLISLIYLSLPLYNHKGFELGHI